jgi:hypothetical protein
MELKSFVIGAACGGLVYAGVNVVLTDRTPTSQSDRGESKRLPRRATSAPINRQHESVLEQGALITIDEARLRSRILPLIE